MTERTTKKLAAGATVIKNGTLVDGTWLHSQIEVAHYTCMFHQIYIMAGLTSVAALAVWEGLLWQISPRDDRRSSI